MFREFAHSVGIISFYSNVKERWNHFGLQMFDLVLFCGSFTELTSNLSHRPSTSLQADVKQCCYPCRQVGHRWKICKVFYLQCVAYGSGIFEAELFWRQCRDWQVYV